MSQIYEIQHGKKNTVLRTVSLPVEKVDSKIKKIISKMIKTMKHEQGCGLAGPQIGCHLRIIITTIGKKIIPMINPKILDHSSQTNRDEEGCLSIPGEFGKVERWDRITVEYLDEYGKQKKRDLEKFDARVVQHEVDHLDGILFPDRMHPLDLEEMERAKRMHSLSSITLSKTA